MKKEYSEIIVVIDRSYSIRSAGLEESMIEGFNGFLAEQKKEPGFANLTAVLFADTYEFIHKGTPLNDVTELDRNNYQADGRSTALFDAVGRTILDVGKRLAAMDEKDRPANVIFVIMTDGQENSSEEFRKKDIESMIKEQSDKYSWQFIYLGASDDPFADAEDIGINLNNVAKFSKSVKGTKMAYAAMDTATKAIRSGTNWSLNNVSDGQTSGE